MKMLVWQIVRGWRRWRHHLTMAKKAGTSRAKKDQAKEPSIRAEAEQREAYLLAHAAREAMQAGVVHRAASDGRSLSSVLQVLAAIRNEGVLVEVPEGVERPGYARDENA